ncbi:MAG: sensor histidine kinase [Lachnospiraceae bacterium]|nr:sensor histidine kinase [Lachnospiraceae bacterium]
MEKKTCIPAAYLRERIVPVSFYIGEALIFMMIAALYGYEGVLANMTYALGLTAFFGGCCLLRDYVRYREKYRELTGLLSAEERREGLPQTSSAMEQAYQQIVMAQEAEKKALVTQLDEKQQNMADYYTMWTHQIKIPLSAMDLLLQNAGGNADRYVEEDADGSGDMQTAKQLREEIFKTGQYVDMALHYARMESISADLSFTKLDVGELVKKALKKFWLLFSGAGLNLQMEDCHAYVVTDGKWFSFVIEQVLSNAIKYTKEGAISIYGTDESGRRVREGCSYLVIEDTGIGIEESDLPRIFERGFTGYNGRMENKSTGIGLYLCRQIMDRLGFSIRVESVRHEGTRVFLGIAQEEILTKM